MSSDADFLGLHRLGRTGYFEFTVEPHLARMDDRLYGGTAIAVSVAAAELVSERTALWMTTQFVSTVETGTQVGVEAEILAPARRTNQVRVTGKGPDGAVVFASLGATGHHRPDGIAGVFENCPDVAAPDESESWSSPFAGMRDLAPDLVEAFADRPAVPPDRGFNRMIELRNAPIRNHPDPGPGRVCLWVRRRDRAAVTPAMAAYMADMVPMSIGRAVGAFAMGTSLDNSIRVGEFVDTEWVLLDLRPHLAAGDYGHGTVHVWSEDRRLLATASQTASMMRFDPANPPWRS
jgi:acyl-CoA thioesterase